MLANLCLINVFLSVWVLNQFDSGWVSILLVQEQYFCSLEGSCCAYQLCVSPGVWGADAGRLSEFHLLLETQEAAFQFLFPCVPFQSQHGCVWGTQGCSFCCKYFEKELKLLPYLLSLSFGAQRSLPLRAQAGAGSARWPGGWTLWCYASRPVLQAWICYATWAAGLGLSEL